MSELSDLIKMLRNKKESGSDYIGIVSRVDGDTAYVQMAGADIMDTPVAMTVDCKPGDRVRIRVNGGKAWITGNDTLPPSNDKKEVATKMSRDMANRSKHIVIKDGIMKFIANTLCVNSKNFKLDEDGNAEFSGTIKGATYTDSTSNFSMDIGAQEDQVGENTPAFKIGGYINGDPNNDYLEVTISLYLVEGDVLPHMYIKGMVKDSPDAEDEHGVSIGFDDERIHFYGSWIENGHLTRVHSSLRWGYNP